LDPFPHLIDPAQVEPVGERKLDQVVMTAPGNVELWLAPNVTLFGALRPPSPHRPHWSLSVRWHDEETGVVLPLADGVLVNQPREAPQRLAQLTASSAARWLTATEPLVLRGGLRLEYRDARTCFTPITCSQHPCGHPITSHLWPMLSNALSSLRRATRREVRMLQTVVHCRPDCAHGDGMTEPVATIDAFDVARRLQLSVPERTVVFGLDRCHILTSTAGEGSRWLPGLVERLGPDPVESHLHALRRRLAPDHPRST
jgi:hypothetical protein